MRSRRGSKATYVPALSLGDRLDAGAARGGPGRSGAIHRAHREYLDLANLRVNIHAFCKELLKTDRLTVGRIDSRYTGRDQSGVSREARTTIRA